MPSSIEVRESNGAQQLRRTIAPHGVTGAEIDRFSGASHLMQRYLRSCSDGELWYLTTAKGASRETVATIQKRINRLQHERNFWAYSAWCFETRPQLHAHFLFCGDSAMVERLKRSYENITIKPVYDLSRLLRGYQAKERTPQAGWGRERQLGGASRDRTRSKVAAIASVYLASSNAMPSMLI